MAVFGGREHTVLIPWPHLCWILEKGASGLPPAIGVVMANIKEGEDAGAAEVVGREKGKKAKCAFCQKVSKVIF